MGLATLELPGPEGQGRVPAVGTRFIGSNAGAVEARDTGQREARAPAAEGLLSSTITMNDRIRRRYRLAFTVPAVVHGQLPTPKINAASPHWTPVQFPTCSKSRLN